MGLSGKAGSTTLRGRIDAGFAEPAKARLEGIPPFGKPVFILVADEGRGTLVLTRENRVLRDAPPEAIVEALAGIALTPWTRCGRSSAAAASPTAHRRPALPCTRRAMTGSC